MVSSVICLGRQRATNSSSVSSGNPCSLQISLAVLENVQTIIHLQNSPEDAEQYQMRTLNS